MYRIYYTRYDPVYGRNWTVLYYKRISAKRTIKASDQDQAIDKLVKSVVKKRPNSKIEINVGGVHSLTRLDD